MKAARITPLRLAVACLAAMIALVVIGVISWNYIVSSAMRAIPSGTHRTKVESSLWYLRAEDRVYRASDWVGYGVDLSDKTIVLYSDPLGVAGFYIAYDHRSQARYFIPLD